MSTTNKIALIAIGLLSCASATYALQLTRPFNPMLIPEYHKEQHWGIYSMLEAGIRHGPDYDACGAEVNVTRVWSPDQNALAALKGLTPDISLDVIDNGVRGHFLTCGDLDLRYGVSIGAHHNFATYFIASFYMPFYSMALRNMCWQELTVGSTGADLEVRETLTNDFCKNVCTLGDGLWLGDWQRSGPGDLALFLTAANEFMQDSRRLLKKVYVNGRFGITIPTGLRQNEDLIFAIPFGYDGSMTLIFGGGLTITAEMLAQQIKAGFDVELLHIFGNDKVRRIKTDINQTEPLLLTKVSAYKDWGLTQQFNLFLQWYHFYRGGSLKLAYQFFKHGRDELSLNTNEFSTSVANTANSLKDWTAHTLMPMLTYDIDWDWGSDYDMHSSPAISIYAKVPFNGKRAIQFSTIGAELTVRW